MPTKKSTSRSAQRQAPSLDSLIQQAEARFGPNAWQQVIIARGEREGRPDQLFANVDPGTMAQLDRYFQVKNSSERFTPLVGAADAVANIGYDALKSSGALPYVAGAMSHVPGLEDLAALGQPNYESGETSAPNFWENTKATLSGLRDAILPARQEPTPGAQALIRGQKGGRVPHKKTKTKLNKGGKVRKMAVGGALRPTYIPGRRPQGGGFAGFGGGGGQSLNSGFDPFASARASAQGGGGGGAAPGGGLVGQVSQTAKQLKNVNTQPQMQTANQLSQFNPLQGQAGNTLQGIIQSGNAVDVNPLVQAAQTRAQHQFGDFLGQSNESFGALGLGSSSARTAAQAREAGRLSEGVAATGLQAGVQAQENAANRQLAAFNPLLQGSGQQLAGLQSAGQLQNQATGLQLQGLQGAGNLQLGNAGLVSGERQAANSLAAQQQMQQAQLAQQAALQNSQMNLQAALAGFGAQGFQRGGRVDERDFLSNLLFGQTFARGPGVSAVATERQFQPLRSVGRGRTSSAARSRPATTFHRDPRRVARDNALLQQMMEQQRAQRAAQMANTLVFNPLQPNVRYGVGATNTAFQNARTMSGLPRTTEGPPARRQSGGVVPGPAVPPDTVPATVQGEDRVRLQGGEGIIPVDLMAELDTAVNPAQLAKVALEIKKVMAENPHPSKRQEGGKVMPSRTTIAPSFPDAVPMGMVEPGNIDLFARPDVDGSTVRSVSFEQDGREILIPTVVGDRVVSDDEAIAEFERTGRHLGIFTNPSTATEYAKRLHEDFESGKIPPLNRQSGGKIPTQFQNTRQFGPPVFSIQGDPTKVQDPLPPPEVSTGRNIGPTEDAEKLYHDARARSAMLRTLAITSPRGTVENLAPLIGRANQEEAAALQNLQGLQALEAERANQAAQIQASQEEAQQKRDFEASESEKQREFGLEHARIQSQPQGTDFSAALPPQGQAPVAGAGVMGGSPAPAGPQAPQGPQAPAGPPAPDPNLDRIQAVIQSTPPEQIEASVAELVQRMPNLAAQPELVALAGATIQQLMSQGMSDEDIASKFATLLQLAG